LPNWIRILCLKNLIESIKIKYKLGKKRRKSSKSNISDIVSLAQLISQSIRLPGNTVSVPMTEEENSLQKKQSLLVHNIDANPEEFEDVSELIRIVGHWFYEDEHVVVLNQFLKQKYHCTQKKKS